MSDLLGSAVLSDERLIEETNTLREEAQNMILQTTIRSGDDWHKAGSILARQVDRIDTDARRIAELEGEVERLRNLLSQTYPYIGWGPAPDGLADKVWEETKHIKEATDGK